MKNETIYLSYSRYKKIETIFMIDETKQHIKNHEVSIYLHSSRIFQQQ